MLIFNVYFITCLSILEGNLENFGGQISPPNSSELNTDPIPVKSAW